MSRGSGDSSAPCSFHKASRASVKAAQPPMKIDAHRKPKELKTLQIPAAAGPTACPPVRAGPHCPSLSMPVWLINVRTWLHKYPGIMCPITVFISALQQSSGWFVIPIIVIFTSAGV